MNQNHSQTILTYPNDTLRQLSTAVEAHEFGRPLEKLVQEMYRTMEHEGGIGLAAPQIGLLKNILVYKTVGEEDESCLEYLINPRFVHMEGSVTVEEGCLSVPGVYGKVKRYERVVVEAQDAFGEPLRKESSVFSAIIIQHEYDHLIGKLFIDHLSALRRQLLLRQYDKQ